MTENLRTAQIGGPAAELIMEEADEDNTDDTQQATRQVIEGGGNTAVNSLGFHRSPRGHTLKLIQDVVTRWNSTYFTCWSDVYTYRFPFANLLMS